MVNLPPKFYTSHIYNGSHLESIPKGKTSVEFFIDYNCPFSGKIFRKLDGEIIPLLKKKGILEKFEITLVNVIQPWHHINSGTSHEVALAVANAYPDQFWKFSSVLFENIESFYDTETYNLTRKQLYEKLIKLAVDNLNGVSAQKLWELVEIKPSADGKPSNAGNLLAKDVKYFTRYHRTLGVHVTPTVTVNGIVFNQIESSTDAAKVVEILEGQL
ncbi:unnamed protein product [Ambrosiozyma monospora]|uniref:Unnamed protein product n=1 Tax=Ambrosiozyma monospora TaxID=43982 RepID=A0ACB5STM8_AMBMO|nr:unnamed protein product [Ambrosiozyma monospora]